nr:type II toxin-antitoxin system RelE/ParE family toxin [Roseateles oligotrophus]
MARQDVDQAIAYYLAEHAPQAALGFVDALEAAYAHIANSPAAGSPRYAQELDIPGLRSWLLTRYPFRVFYLERPASIDIWRVLHTRRDIPSSLQESESE